MRFQLQTNRSRNLLGVRSSDWYQTKALGLYFFFVCIFFVFRKCSVSKVWKDNLTLDQILDHLQTSSHRIRLARAIVDTANQLWTKIFEISNMRTSAQVCAQRLPQCLSSPNIKSVHLIFASFGQGASKTLASTRLPWISSSVATFLVSVPNMGVIGAIFRSPAMVKKNRRYDPVMVTLTGVPVPDSSSELAQPWNLSYWSDFLQNLRARRR